MLPRSLFLAGLMLASACHAATPPAAEILAAMDVKARLIPQGDLVAVALDVTNGNPRSAVMFALVDFELVDKAGAAQTIDPLHPLVMGRLQRQLFEASHGTYYQGVHTIDNVIHGGNPDHFLGVFKKADFVRGRIKLRYYVPDYDSQPEVVKEFPLGH